MTPFDTWYATHHATSLPWEVSKEQLREAYNAGLACAADSAAGGPVGKPDATLPMFPGAPDYAPPSDTVFANSVTAEDIYAAYPRKVGKQAAIKAINKAAKHPSARMTATECAVGRMGMLLNRTKAYAAATAQWPAADKQYIPHPATWFNRGSYDDDPAEWQRHNPATQSQFSKTH